MRNKLLIFLILPLFLTLSALGQGTQKDFLGTPQTFDGVGDSVLATGNGYSTSGFQISGTWDGVITFSGSINGTDWISIKVWDSEAGASATEAIANGIYFASNSGLRYVKAQMTTRNSGTAIVQNIATDDPSVLATLGAAGGGGGAEGTVDLTGINGVTPSTGNGTAGTGTLRVAIASNNTAFSVNASATGPAAHDAAASGNPVIDGGVASAAAPTSVSADGDAVQAWYLRNGAQATVLTAAGALVGGDATNGLDVDVTRMNDGGNSITVDNGGTFATQATIAAGATNIAKAEDVASADADVGVPAMAIRQSSPANTSGTNGDWEALQMNAGRLWTSATIDAALPAGSNVIGALTANQSVNVAQINGVTPLMGAGATGTGSPRVTLATDGQGQVADNAGFTDGTTRTDIAGFIFDEVAGTALTENDAAAARVDSKRAIVHVLEDATTRGQRAAVSSAGALASNLTQVAGASIATGHGTASGSIRVELPTDGTGLVTTNPATAANWGIGATGSAVPANAQYAGAVTSGNLTGLIQAGASVKIDVSTATTTQLVALASSQKIYITSWDVIAAGTGTIKLVYGTGSSCGTGTTDLTGAYSLVAQSGIAKGNGLGPVLVVPASNALCVTTSAAVGMQGSVSYTQF